MCKKDSGLENIQLNENEKKIFMRTEALIGENALLSLKKSHVAVFGLGGVGSFVAESLARSGVGELTLVDDDAVSLSNINRQLYALQSTVGKPKVTVARDRILDINPSIKLNLHKTFFSLESQAEFDFSKYDYVADCIDSVKSKLLLIELCNAAGKKIISAMGAGNKLDPSCFEISDISKTSVCPLCRIMRQELKKRGISGLNVVYSKEKPVEPFYHQENLELKAGHKAPASIAFVPPVMGMMMAGFIIRELGGV